MATFSLTCPHCHVQNTAFTIQFEKSYAIRKIQQGELFATCNNCHRGVVAKASSQIGHSLSYLVGPTGDIDHIKSTYGLTVDTWLPRQEVSSCPDEVPSDIARNFIKGVDSIKRNDREGAAMFLGRALDLALKNLHPELTGMMGQRIKQLKVDSDLPNPMIEWAGELNTLELT